MQMCLFIVCAVVLGLVQELDAHEGKDATSIQHSELSFVVSGVLC